MNSNSIYLAYLDLLGTKNFSMKAKTYYDNIIQFKDRIIDNHILLASNDNAYKIAFFSDSCYIESKNLFELLKYLEALRDDLSTMSLFFNAAVVKVNKKMAEYKSFSYTSSEKNNGSISGITFSDNSIATAYLEQNRFKGIGIHLSNDVYNDAKSVTQINAIMTDSIYLSDHTKYDSLTVYHDVICKPSSEVLPMLWMDGIIESYFYASCDNPRYGKYYISLLTNIINNASNDVGWNRARQEFISPNPIYNAMYSIFIDEKKYDLLTGIDILAFIFINKLFSSNLLEYQTKRITHKLFDNVLKKYLDNFDSVPWNVFLDNGDNKEKFRRYFREYITSTRINKLQS